MGKHHCIRLKQQSCQLQLHITYHTPFHFYFRAAPLAITCMPTRTAREQIDFLSHLDHLRWSSFCSRYCGYDRCRSTTAQQLDDAQHSVCRSGAARDVCMEKVGKMPETACVNLDSSDGFPCKWSLDSSGQHSQHCNSTLTESMGVMLLDR